MDDTIRLFVLCEAMGWNHLPVDGGLYAQSPELLDKFMFIFQEKSAEDARRQAEEEAKSKNPASAMRRGASRGR